jgi:hypothetical protein
MTCIDRRPRCGVAEGDVVPKPLTDIVSVLGIIIAVISALVTVGKVLGAISIVGDNIVIGGVTIFGAGAAGAIGGLVAAAAIVIIVVLYANDRCNQGEGLLECVAGVVTEVVSSFSSGWDEVLPFSAMHDRVDLIAKSRFWDVIEDNEAFVFCTEAEPPRRSEILRCYFFDRQVCDAASGAVTGAVLGGMAGVLAGALVAIAIGCATVIFCLLAIIVAALVAATVALIGAFAGGQIGKATSTDDSPTADTGETLAIGQLVSVHGSLKRRENDQGANVIYWASSAQFHGTSVSPQPFSYCEIDEELVDDGCERAPAPIL